MLSQTKVNSQNYKDRIETIRSESIETTAERIFLSLSRLIIGTCYVFDGETLHTFSMPSEKRKLEELLRQYLVSKKESLLDLSPSGVFLLSRDGRILMNTAGY